jgi:hypothetical protein
MPSLPRSYTLHDRFALHRLSTAGYNQFPMAIRVRLGQEEVQVEPGGSAQLLAVVRNEGDAPDQVALEVEGVDAEWCAIPIPSFPLAPGEEVQERILIRPPRSTESRAGTYPILVRARSLENGGSGVAQASITIRPYSMLTLEIAPKRGIVSPLRKRVPYELALANYGNTEQTVQLHVSDPEDEVVFELERERVLLAPGETQSVLVYAQPAADADFSEPRAVQLHRHRTQRRRPPALHLCAGATGAARAD